MPADFIIYPELQVVFSYGWGTLTFEDIRDHRTRLLHDANFAADFRQIAMLSDVAEIKISNEEIEALAGEPVFTPRSQRALVAAPCLHFGLSRMFHAYSDIQRIGVFRSLSEGAAWVAVPMDLAAEAFQEIRQVHKLA
ncbi:MAG: hypothetical protein V4819_24485 [Verrucomicrobiota bacterium]